MFIYTIGDIVSGSILIAVILFVIYARIRGV